MKIVLIIPARYQSSRLPGKPLIDLHGLPMIVRTYQQCEKAFQRANIFVATDDQRIADTCDSHSINCLMTSHNCLSGTDRVAEASEQVNADTYINVQGDEPIFNPEDIVRLVNEAEKHPDDVINGYSPIESEEQYRNGSIPKVVCRPDGRLLYMSRAAIPTSKSFTFDQANRQVCAYAFPRAALRAFHSARVKTCLEQIEDIEILRFLELGFEVRMIPMTSTSIAVDVEDDVRKVISVLRDNSN